MFIPTCIDFNISNCKSKFWIGLSKYKLLLTFTFQCGVLVSNKFQVGSYKKEI